MATIVDDINKLLKTRVGDADRLTRIKDLYQKDGAMSVEDRKYVGELAERYLAVHSESDSEETKSSDIKKSESDSFANDDHVGPKDQKGAGLEDNDLFSILKKRLAEGEITSKEYDKLRKKLDKEEKSQNKKMKEKQIEIEYHSTDKPSKKKMSAKKKVGIGIGIFFIIIVVFFVVGLTSYYVAPGSMMKNPDSVTGISQYWVTKDGSLYKVRFSLIDANNAYVTSDAKVSFIVKTQDGQQLYADNFDIKSTDFQTYSLVLTGAPVVAYAWQIDVNKLQHSDISFPKAYLTVTLSNGKSFTADTPVF